MHIVIYCDNHDEIPHSIAHTFHFGMLLLSNKSIVVHMIEQIMLVQSYFVKHEEIDFTIDKITFITNKNPHILRNYLKNFAEFGCDVEVITTIISMQYTFDILSYNNANGMLFFTHFMLFNPYKFYEKCTEVLLDTRIKAQKNTQKEAIFLLDKESLCHQMFIENAILLSLNDIYQCCMQNLHGAYAWLVREERDNSTEKSDVEEILSGSEENISSMQRIYIGRQCRIHASTILHAPLIIGNNCYIEKNCTLGPFAVIGKDTIMSQESHISNSILHEKSYISPMISIKDAIFLQGTLHHMNTDVCVMTPDLLATSFTNPEKIHSNTVHTEKRSLTNPFYYCILKFTTYTIFLCISPIILVQWALARGRFSLINYTTVDDIPSIQCSPTIQERKNSIVCAHESLPYFLRSPLLRFFPAMLSVLQGKIDLVGEEIETSKDDKVVKLKSKIQDTISTRTKGLIAPWLGLAKAPLSPIEKYMHNAWYSHVKSPKNDVYILFKACINVYGHWRNQRKVL